MENHVFNDDEYGLKRYLEDLTNQIRIIDAESTIPEKLKKLDYGVYIIFSLF